MTGVRTRHRHLALAVAITASLIGCSGDLGLNDFQFACEKDSDCGEGGRCNPAAGCVSIDAGHPDGGASDAAIPLDGGIDAGRDAGRDGGSDAGDAGSEDTGNDDAGDAGTDNDGGGDVDTVDAGDAGGQDTGTFVLTWSSLYQAGAGSCTSADYRLLSVTGWVALPSGFSQTNVLRPESPVKK